MKTTAEKGIDGKFPDERPHKKISHREEMFVTYLLENKKPTEAARLAGFSDKTANGRVYGWIRNNRISSDKPYLFDLYHERLKKKLRLHDISIDNILDELKILGFSSLHHFIEFPTNSDMVRQRMKDLKSRRFLGIATAAELAELEDWEINVETKDPLAPYRPGATIRLKAFEDIPKQLIPAIAEISETRDGIKIKLHNKLDAIDKLARYLKMYEDAKSDDEQALKVSEINITVKGKKSPLLAELLGEDSGEKRQSA